ncbi:polynucleotide adenylyltransferase PcnB [Aliikangiella sp. IMCC44359]|uniref:polynucleotide adenylyltransferase PcnB n=1 Tax=Aliikangiella sp. IMCC44359 TaxID=3459125 RepID=UPI00403B03B8
MITKIWQRLTNKKSAKHPSTPLVVTRDKHNISRNKISKSALKVLYRLNDAGFEAFLVGGGVRDILLGLSPKDFDIATSATPEEVCKLFKNSRLIGRRFKLAHVLFGREVIEVATFRGDHTSSSSKHAVTSKQGMLVRDNVYGNLEQDAFRRDFTVNALYYSAKDFTLLDHTGGLEDLKAKQMRLIGDPITRYQEDPVRILRAIRLSCKLNLLIEPKTAAPIAELSEMLEHISAARLWDESNKLLLSGYAEKTWHQLCQYDVARHLFAQTCQSLNQNNAEEFNAFIQAALVSTDKRIDQKQPVTPAFLFAVFLWQPLQDLTTALISKGTVPYEASQKAAARVLDIQRKSIAIPKRFSIVIKEIWSLQFRLMNRKKRNIDSLIQHPKFRAAYDFLCLRALDNDELKELAKWWTDFQNGIPEERNKLIKSVYQPHTGRSRKKRKPRKKTQFKE